MDWINALPELSEMVLDKEGERLAFDTQWQQRDEGADDELRELKQRRDDWYDLLGMVEGQLLRVLIKEFPEIDRERLTVQGGWRIHLAFLLLLRIVGSCLIEKAGLRES